MFYIVREWHSMGGGFEGIPFSSWYEYSIETSKPSNKKCFVKVDKTKDDLKKLVKSKGSLENALEHLFNEAVDEDTIEEAFK